MNRRDWVRFIGAALASPEMFAAVGPRVGEEFLEKLVRGFSRNVSPGYAVCDYPDGTKLKSCVAKSGKTYVSVARMMPALAAAGAKYHDILLGSFRHAFDPSHPDYWEEPPKNKASQRQVEACLVAWSLYRLGDEFIGKLSSQDRTHIQKWLASCTVFPERTTNHAWFHAINNAVRLALAHRWKEFQGDETYMLADLKALDGLGSVGDGWYSDSPIVPIFDYYNFFTFASHFLMWHEVAGKRYAEIARPFLERLDLFLQRAPYFFASHGGHVLFGRSLIYRWAVLMPMVFAYQQGRWPHSPGLLRALVRRNLDYHWRLGAFDAERGKLRETFSAEGSPDIREAYVDNGHPYWGMPAFSFLTIPAKDAFWTAAEEPLPVERGDFTVRFEGPRMLLAGSKASGQVRWIQSQNAHYRPYYRDKYVKFSYSSHFPYNVMSDKDRAPWDNTLVFRNPKTKNVAARLKVNTGRLTADGVEVLWLCELDGMPIEVTSTVRIAGEFEGRSHVVKAPEAAVAAGVEAIEGGAAVGLGRGEAFERKSGADWSLVRTKDGRMAATWNRGGYQGIETVQSFDESGRRNVNLVHAESAVNSLRGVLRGTETRWASLHYASPKPPAEAEVQKRAAELRGWFPA